MSNARYTRSRDGCRISFNVSGNGPLLVMLHGGMQSADVWTSAGYVARLKTRFTVATIDLRGHGDSDKPFDPAGYSIDSHCEDVLAVADAVGVVRFSVWGYSLGANIGRALASRTARVAAFVMVGVPFGPAAFGNFRVTLQALGNKWMPILRPTSATDLAAAVAALSVEERAYRESGRAGHEISWLIAMLDWPDVEPADMRCPTLWIVGTGNEGASSSAEALAPNLGRTHVKLIRLAGLSHEAELTNCVEILAVSDSFLDEIDRAEGELRSLG